MRSGVDTHIWDASLDWETNGMACTWLFGFGNLTHVRRLSDLRGKRLNQHVVQQVPKWGNYLDVQSTQYWCYLLLQQRAS